MINLAYFEAWLSLVERCVRDAEVVGSNPVASTTWQGQLETLILSAFPVLFACSNEPCVDSLSCGCRELAHGQTHDRLDTYGECRDSHELRSSEVTCRQGSLRYQSAPCMDLFRNTTAIDRFMILCLPAFRGFHRFLMLLNLALTYIHEI